MWSASTSLAQPEREQLVEEGKTLYQEYLKNKTKVKEYWRTDVGWDGFIGALEQNRRAIESAKGVEVTHREPQETIRVEFAASLAKLKPLPERIELTDKSIDQIVYKLYGLTEEEIAVVEGRS